MRLCYLISCSILLFVAGPACSTSPSGDNGNANGNTNGNTNTNGDSEAPAEVGFPDVTGDGSAILTIDQDDGVTATILGDANDAGTAASVTGLSGNTGEADFSADFNSDLQAERVTIGDATIVFDYSGTDSVSFSVSRGEETLFSGNDLSVTRDIASRAARVVQQFTLEDMVVCGLSWIEVLAIIVEQELSPDSFALPDPEFIACLQDVEIAQEISVMICVTNLVLIPSIIDALLRCQLFEDPLACFDRGAPALEAISFFSQIMNVVLVEIIFQLRLDSSFCASASPP